MRCHTQAWGGQELAVGEAVGERRPLRERGRDGESEREKELGERDGKEG